MLRTTLILLTLLVLPLWADNNIPYAWNKEIPEKKPLPHKSNGKLVLFDVSHGGTAGNSDWVINGGFSDFADALQQAGYRVKEYRGVDKDGDGIIRFFDDRQAHNLEKNEAVITFAAIEHADVFVMAETNRPLKVSEYAALKKFVDSGKGLLLIGDHYNADRNLNTWDATEVFNGYNRSRLSQFDLGGAYGDLRNPAQADKGWLAKNFGLRFRFNAIDCKVGASDIVPPAYAEGLTKGVDPVLIAAGGTLAIVEPTIAKGIVFLADDDPVRPWNHAIDSGLYFGGRMEGPFVAISKPSAGKAAFVGDSSPIEDASPKYLREENGREKHTYPGWTQKGNAAQLMHNIVDWLATPEPYVGFRNYFHRWGEPTPNPMTQEEKADPDRGRPWRQPSAGYDPWDTDTFAAGSFGAPWPEGGPSGGTVSVREFFQLSSGKKVEVLGIIDREINGEYGLALRDTQEASKEIMIKIPDHLKDFFSPHFNPDIVGSEVLIKGHVGEYMGKKGMRSVQDIEVR